jgi:AraC family transcriptional regulator of adaptative response/methylated-DNA-[protein]-cysteine methyltransferase
MHEDDCWTAVLTRDRAFDGRFVTGVLSTGIYCRPSCPARHPARANVRFFADGAEAREAGLRACKRCVPDGVAGDEAAVLAVIGALKRGQPANLAGLAEMTGYSPSHLQRIFTRATGLSPAAYERSLREERARTALSGAERVAEAIYDAGYEAPSRFYDDVKERLGMAPGEWRKGGRGQVIHWAVLSTSLGPMLVAATARGVCRLSFAEDEAALARRFPHAELVPAGEAFHDLFTQVVAAVERPGTAAHIPLDVQGTAFSSASGRRCGPSAGRDPLLRPARCHGRQSQGQPRGGQRERRERRRGADPLPPGGAVGRSAGGLCLWGGDQAGTAAAGAGVNPSALHSRNAASAAPAPPNWKPSWLS